MCHEVQSTYKCACVIVRQTFCNDSVNRTLCDVVSTEQKHLSLKCSRCRQQALERLTTAAATAVPKQNPAIVIPLPTSNKRKATPGQEEEQERPAKKAKTQAEVKAKREKSPKDQHRKKLEYKKKYRQAQAAKKIAAEQEQKKKAEALAMQAESETAALSRARAEEAQRQNDEEMTEEGILTASEEEEDESEDSEDDDDEDESGSNAELACLSEFESEQNEYPTPPSTPILLTLRHNQPREYHIPTADLLPCHGYYYRIPRLAPWDNPLGEDGGCCKNCWLKVDGYTIKDMDRDEKDGEEGDEGIKVAVLVRAWEMFEGGYWSEAE